MKLNEHNYEDCLKATDYTGCVACAWCDYEEKCDKIIADRNKLQREQKEEKNNEET